MSYYGYPPYVPVAERRKKAEKVAAKMQKKGVVLTPVIGGRGNIAKTFWGANRPRSTTHSPGR